MVSAFDRVRNPQKIQEGRCSIRRDTRTSTQSRRIVRRKDASWSLNWPSGANLLARKQHMYFFGASVTTVFLFFFVIGRVLTRQDSWTVKLRVHSHVRKHANYFSFSVPPWCRPAGNCAVKQVNNSEIYQEIGDIMPVPGIRKLLFSIGNSDRP